MPRCVSARALGGGSCLESARCPAGLWSGACTVCPKSAACLMVGVRVAGVGGGVHQVVHEARKHESGYKAPSQQLESKQR